MRSASVFLRNVLPGAALAALPVWSLLDASLAGWLLWPALLAVSQPIFAGSLEAARLKRRAWLGQYLQASSPWHRLLRGGVPMLLWHQGVGVALGLLLLIKLRAMSAWLWPVLLAGGVLLLALRRCLRRRLARHVRGEYLDALTRRLIVPLSAVPLALGVVAVSLWLPQPWMVGMGWQEAMRLYLPGVGADGLFGTLERLAALGELTPQWALQNALGDAQQGALALLGWSLALMTQAAFAWAFIRLLVGIGAARSLDIP